MKIDPYYQLLKCSAETLVCKDIRDADIHGDSLDRGHQIKVGSSKIAMFATCGRYIFRKFIYETKIIMCEYVGLVPNGFSSTWKETNDLE